ncbi:MAG: hypothetical protein K1V96_09975 [Lachnospiraceae bacterium]
MTIYSKIRPLIPERLHKICKVIMMAVGNREHIKISKFPVYAIGCFHRYRV